MAPMIPALLRPLRLVCGSLLWLSLGATLSLRAEEAQVRIGASDPWTRSDVLLPADFLASQKGDHPPYLVFQVGFPFLYKAGHIPGSAYVGAGKDPEGIDALKKALSTLPKDRKIVLYCGCCPLDVCPNLRPAFETAKEMGFFEAKILYLPHDFAQDWIRKGYPTEKGG